MKKIKNYSLNFLLKCIVKTHRFFRKKNSPSDHILIVSTTGLGDTLWATPSLRKLRKKYPDKKIWVLTHELGYKLFQYNPNIDKIVVWKKPYIFCARPLISLWNLSFDKIFVFHASQRIVFFLLAFLKTNALISTESKNKNTDFLFSCLKKNIPQHEIMRRLALDNLPTSDLGLDFFLKKEEKEQAKALLLNHGYNPSLPLVFLHPGAKDRYKCLPLFRIKEIMSSISSPIQVFLSGDESLEKDLLDDLEKCLPKTIRIKSSSIRQYAALLSFAEILIAADTGPIHLASCFNLPTVALFSPTDPKFSAPFTPTTHVLYKEKCCSKCLKKDCLESFCLLQIPSNAIVKRVNLLLQRINKVPNEPQDSDHSSQLQRKKRHVRMS